VVAYLAKNRQLVAYRRHRSRPMSHLQTVIGVDDGTRDRDHRFSLCRFDD